MSRVVTSIGSAAQRWWDQCLWNVLAIPSWLQGGCCNSSSCILVQARRKGETMLTISDLFCWERESFPQKPMRRFLFWSPVPDWITRLLSSCRFRGQDDHDWHTSNEPWPGGGRGSRPYEWLPRWPLPAWVCFSIYIPFTCSELLGGLVPIMNIIQCTHSPLL